MSMLRVLIIDDDEDLRIGLAEFAKLEGFDASTCGSLKEARERLSEGPVDVALVDLSLPDGEGIDLIQELKDSPGTDVVIISGVATVDSAIAALRLGALDYLTKPIDNSRLKAVLANAMRVRSLKEHVGSLRDELRKFGRFGRMIGNSPQMNKIYDLIAKVAPTDATVLVTGESGTGKELVAQAIVDFSSRRHAPFIPLDCGAIPPSLIESELFGHERGSFTGATQQRRGHFERASGGTLFLDEITEMPIELQVKLLRVLESGTLTRIGGEARIPVTVRLIAASNRPPKEAIQAKKLREDLFYRLNVFPIVLPPLRERDGDALLLADHFLDLMNRTEATSKRLSAAARERISAYSWPGNVRELKNELHRAFIMSGKVIEFDGLTAAPPPGSAPRVDGGGPPDVGGSLDEAERRLILATLEQLGGDKKKAAETLGISLKTLYNRLHLYARN
ncbi:MAG TPA: sigma-54 dependent transcriptional regulator [Candidatus Eisenbacteria bacterium]|nr:sigma-54 dependent transcriptional regulator [Candidatus Eisenbacteria bacterium]